MTDKQPETQHRKRVIRRNPSASLFKTQPKPKPKPQPAQPRRPLPVLTPYLWNDVLALRNEEERLMRERIGGSGYDLEDLNQYQMRDYIDELRMTMPMEFYASNNHWEMLDLMRAEGVPEPLDLAIYTKVTTVPTRSSRS